MAVNAVTAPSAAAPAPSPFATLTERFDNFLLLLTKQLQYQDPLSPLDTNEFTSQLVQFTGVEQAIATNKKLDQIIDLQSSDQTSTSAALLGTTVEARGDGLWLADGHSEATYELSRNPAAHQGGPGPGDLGQPAPHAAGKQQPARARAAPPARRS